MTAYATLEDYLDACYAEWYATLEDEGMTKIFHTSRGYARKEFTDANGRSCSIQDSSVATSDLLWLGCDKGEHVRGECLARMHLTRKQAATLASLLTRFADTGTIQLPNSRLDDDSSER